MSFFRPELGEEDDISDGSLIGEKHDQAIDADAFAGGRRHAVFEGAQKILVHSMGFFVAGFMLGRLGFESLALIERIVQLREGVGDFAARDIELEAIGQARDPYPSCAPAAKSPSGSP